MNIKTKKHSKKIILTLFLLIFNILVYSTDIEKNSFELYDTQNKLFKLSDNKGKVVILDFFATWCPPCKKEIPHLIEIYKKYKDKGVVLVGISNEGKNLLEPFIEKMGINYPILIDKNNVSAKFGVSSIPTLFIFDKNGKLVNKHIGFYPGLEKELEEEINKLIK